jgi:hypothetical protein
MKSGKHSLTYSVVVRDPGPLSVPMKKRRILCDCGHKHKSLDTAAQCHAKLTKRRHDGTYRAPWYHAAVEDSTGKRFNNSELDFRNYIL